MRPAVFFLIAFLLTADGLVVGALAMRRATTGTDTDEQHDSGGPSWTNLTPSDLRIATAFGVLEREGLSSALEVLVDAAAEDSAILRSGHQLAHALGRTALNQSGDPALVAQCSPVFASGCFHGVVESYLQLGNGIDMTELESMCRGAGDGTRPGPVNECMHGLGHGLLGATGYDVYAALGHCDAATDVRVASFCYSGVFMEAINAAFGKNKLGAGAHAHHEMASGEMGEDGMAGEHMMNTGPATDLGIPDPSHPYSPCDRFDGVQGDVCWGYQGYVVLRYVDFDAARAFVTCDGAPAGRVSICYESVGLHLTGIFQRDDAWIIDQCQAGQAEYASSCAVGAAKTLVGIDWTGTRAAGFCAVSPTGWKQGCYSAVGELLADLDDRASVRALCEGVEQDYVQACLEAGGLSAEG